VIDKLQIYTNGILCEARSDTDLCDEFLDELISWFNEKYGQPLRTMQVRAYLSQMEVSIPLDVRASLEKFSAVGTLISTSLEAYGLRGGNYRGSGIRLHSDFVDVPPPHSPEFVFERRAEIPYSKNIYFTSAGLRTLDHVRVLEALQEALQ
jgi:hypothetical protein